MRLVLGLIVLATAAFAQTFAGSALLDQTLNDAVKKGEIPGAVLVVGHDGQVVYRHAYGDRALEPRVEAMTADTIFDCASLTKVIATTSSLMKLFEEGKFRLNDPIDKYIPEFQGGRSLITIRELMTHFSGLRPDLDLKPAWHGYETGIRLATEERSVRPPDVRFQYSDINFILLGELVHRLSGETLDVYAQKNIFLPLHMNETMFLPPAGLIPRIAPTEWMPGDPAPLRGVVHDPTARDMGGVAGHAGLFSTAGDLARFAQMMLNGGELDHVRVFSAATVRKFTTPQSPADQPILRGLGWDIDSPFSGNRGELFPIGSYGHTGFTGTSLWIDPASQTYVVLMTNSVHPHLRPAITPLRGKVATIAAASLGIQPPAGVTLTGYNETIAGAGVHREVARNGETLSGLDVLEQERFAPVMGKRIGLITNQTGVDRAGRRNIDVLRDAGVHIVALFSPEHGFLGREDHTGIQDSLDAATGLHVYSLYGKTKRPTPEMLRGVDALVFDIQDVGARFYTYETTMAYAMQSAAEARIPFYVLDRPNPITGTHVEGPMLDADKESFIGFYPLPLRHGMTMGEIAEYFNAQARIGADLHVVRMKDWQRGDWFDSTHQLWVNPSPNMRSLSAALLYPGVAMLEYSRNYSVGRGTEDPFEQVGADFINGHELAAYLNGRFIPGVRVYPTRFEPASSNYAGKTIEGVRFVITDRERFDSARLGLELASALLKLYPGRIVLDPSSGLIGNSATIQALNAGEDPRAIVQNLDDGLEPFLQLRARYLLYK